MLGTSVVYYGVVTWYEGLILLLVGLGYNFLLLRQSLGLRGERPRNFRKMLDEIGEANGSVGWNVGLLSIGMVVLVVGAYCFIEGSVALANSSAYLIASLVSLVSR